MTQDDIVEMAKKAGIIAVHTEGDGTWMQQFIALEAFAKLVAAKEREACESIEYDLAESPAMFATMAEYKSYRNGVEKYSAAIRARQ